MKDFTGQQFGDYRLIHLIGKGGFSDVYRGEDIRTKAQVAIKIFHQRMVSSNDIARFINELRSLLRLKHPHILQILDLGVRDDVSYLVMQYAPKGTLAHRYPRGTRVPLESINSYVRQIASALQYAHDLRIIHRDVKPQNMFIGSNDEILLGDFGIATPASDSSDQITGEIIGTANFMAPEQIQGKPLFASDQYGLGVTVYQWLCGELPFHGSTMEILIQHVSATPPSLRERGANVSPAVEAVVLKALSKDPKERYDRVMDFADALEEAVSYEYSTRSMGTPSSLIHLEDSELEQLEVHGEVVAPSSGTTLPSLEDYTPHDDTLPSIDRGEVSSPQPVIPTDEVSPELLIAPAASSTLQFTQTVSPKLDLRDFFIIYTKADRKWARWVAWELEQAHNSVILPSWYLHSQSNFDMEMAKAAAKAKRIVLILSPESLNLLKAQPMYLAMLQKELTGDQDKLLLICVRDCGNEHEQLLDSLHYIDIVGEDELTARAILQASILDEGISLTIHPAFPTTTIRRSMETEPAFPPDNLTITQGQFSVATSLNTVNLSTLPLSLPDIEIFFSYSHKDKKMRAELEKFMSHLKRHPSIKAWHDGEIGAGMAWAQEIDTHLNKANIILLLVSQDFIASNYCYDIEMQKAIQRHETGEARVIPILLRPAFWEDTPIGKLQVLPTGAKPIAMWSNKNLAMMDVVKGIQKAIELLANRN